METAARALLLLFAIALVLNIAGVGGQSAAKSPSEAWGRVKAWSSSKLIGG